MGDRSLRHTVWEERRAILEQTPQSIDINDDAAGKWLITQPRTRPSYVPWITYSNTDILQAPGTVVLCYPADLFSYSVTARYVIREYGQENIFRLKPSVGTAVRLDRSSTAPWNNQIFLLCIRASNKHPLLHETLHACSRISYINSTNVASRDFTCSSVTQNDQSTYYQLGTPRSATTSRVIT